MSFCIPVSWYAIFTPAGTPRDAAARINAEAKRALQVPEVKDKLASPTIEADGTTPEKLTVTLNDEMERIRLLVKLGALKPE
jgi:tripartite-type tricarboxylate transporter receptor subunit TctC